MNISNIIKYIIIVFIIIFFNNSCTQILKEDDKNEIILNSKVIDLIMLGEYEMLSDNYQKAQSYFLPYLF